MNYRNIFVWGVCAILGCRAPENGVVGTTHPPSTPAAGYIDLRPAFWQNEIALANGGELNVSVSISNRGTAGSNAAVGLWKLQGPGIEFVWEDNIPALAPGAEAKLTFLFSFLPAHWGSFTLTFIADPGNVENDTQTENNTVSIKVIVASPESPPRYAELEVTFGASPLTFSIYSYVVTSVTITNHGPEPAPIVGIWEFEGPSYYFSVPVTVPVLNSGESKVLFYHQPPEPASRGWHTLSFTAMPEAPLVEADISNNFGKVDVLILPYPNAKVEVLSATPLEITAATLVNLDVRWSNTGLSPLVYSELPSQAAKVYLLRLGETPAWSNYVGSVSAPVLGPGEVTNVSYQVPALRGPGDYTWHIMAATTIFETSLSDDSAWLEGVKIDSPLQLAWTSSISTPSIASPTTAEVNGDGVWDLLIAGLRLSPTESDLFAIDGNTGLPLWSSDAMGTPLLLHTTGTSVAFAFSPDEKVLTAFNSLNGDWLWDYPTGPTFVSFTATDFDNNASMDLLVAANEGLALLKATDGTLQANWPFPGDVNSFASSPTLIDFNNDALTDVLMASLEGKVYAFRGTGASSLDFAWEATFEAPVVGAPVAYDFDQDGELEIVMSDLSGKLAVLSPAGETRLSVALPASRVWMSPAVVRSPAGLTVVVSGSTLPKSDTVGWSSSLMAYDSVNGDLKWKMERPGTAGPVVAIDLDNDGYDEMLWLVGDRSPAVFPLNLSAMNGSKGQLYVVSNTGGILTVFELEGTVWAPPIAGDIDSDGLLDIVIGTAGPDGALIRLTTPWFWSPERGWAGAAGSSIKPGHLP